MSCDALKGKLVDIHELSKGPMATRTAPQMRAPLNAQDEAEAARTEER